MENIEKKELIKWLLIGFGIILILWFITSLFNHSYKKKVSINDYVSEQANYTIPSTSIKSILPEIKLDSDDAKEVNMIIKEAYNSAITSKNTQFTYEASVGKKYLSIALITNRVDIANKLPYSSIKTYTFDIKSGKSLDQNELLNQVGVDFSDISASFENQMKKYYDEQVESMYFTKDDCNYQCFLDARGISSYEDEIHLFTMDDKLMYYRPFFTYSKWNDQDFYRYENFLFEIKK